MAKQTVNIGSAPNDGTGDPARTAFDKINDNFNETYGVSGILKSNGTDTLSAAVAGTDYAAASHTHTLSDVTDSGAAAGKGVTGLDANAVTGTAGTSGDLATWNGDGDLVDGPTPPSGAIVGTTDSQTLTNKTLTTPVIAQINDSNGNEALTLAATASAVNYLDVANSATGNDVTLSAAGSDTDVGVDISPKGAGNVTLGNFVLDADQSIGVGQDNYVLTYDNATGLISLEAASGGGGTPGGSSGQVQYNNAGSFGGVNLWREDANTLAMRNSATAQTFYAYNTFTDASNYERGFLKWNSNALDIGAESAGTGNTDNTEVHFRTDDRYIFYVQGSPSFVLQNSVFRPSGANKNLGDSSQRWNDFFLEGDIQSYASYGGPTNYQRLGISTAKATASAVSGASATLSSLIPDGAVVVGVTTRVGTGLGTSNGTTGYNVGDGTDPDRWGAVTGTASGTTSDNRDWTDGTISAFTSANDVVLTAVGGNFDGTGSVEVAVHYFRGEAD